MPGWVGGGGGGSLGCLPASGARSGLRQTTTPFYFGGDGQADYFFFDDVILSFLEAFFVTATTCNFNRETASSLESCLLRLTISSVVPSQ